MLVVYPDHGVVVALLGNLALSPLAAEASAQMLADPFLYRTSTGRTATRIIPVGKYEYEFEGRSEKGELEFRRSADGSAGWMTTPSFLEKYAERFGIRTAERLSIESVRVDERDGLITLATPVGLLGIRASFGRDDFKGDFVALNARALFGEMLARRLPRVAESSSE